MEVAKAKKSKKITKRYPERAKDVPVTQSMLFDVREELKAQIRGLDAKVDQRFHELKILVEEQNAQNRIVLDGLTSVFTRQERIESKLG